MLALVGTDGRLVGTVLVRHDGHRGWVYYLAVAKTSRGTGAGRALMAAAQEWIRAHGVPKLLLTVRSDNLGVLDFYERLGYEPQDVRVLGRRLE